MIHGSADENCNHTMYVGVTSSMTEQLGQESTGLIDNDDSPSSSACQPGSTSMNEAGCSYSQMQQNDPEQDMALFLMRAADELDLPHSGFEKLCHSVNWLLEVTSSRIHGGVKKYLPDHPIITSIHSDLEKACSPGDELEKLSCRFYRESFYTKHFNYVVILYNALSQLIIVIIIETGTCLSW